MDVCNQLNALRSTPRELWVVMLVRIGLAFSYFAIAAVFVVFLQTQHGYNDVDSMWMYGLWGCAVSLFSLAGGPLIDVLKIRRSLIVGSLFFTIGALMLALSFERDFVFYAAILFFLPIGSALGLPVTDNACEHYSYADNKNLVYAIAYGKMNQGAAYAGLAEQAARYKFGASGVKIHGIAASAERIMIFISGAVASIFGLLAALTMSEVAVRRDGDVEIVLDAMQANTIDDAPLNNSTPIKTVNVLVIENRWRPIEAFCAFRRWLRQDFSSMWYDVTFWQISLFVLLTLPARHVFRHLDTTLPIWSLRVFGVEAPIGFFYAINPIGSTFLPPPVQIMLKRFDPYNRVIFGSFISSTSLLIMAVKDVNYGHVVAALLLFTLGEAIYSPTITQYVMALSPNDRRGQYSSLSSAPIFIGKIIVAIVSGNVLSSECPADGDLSNCNHIWIWIASVSMATPLLLLIFKRFIHTEKNRAVIARKNGTAKIEPERSHERHDNNDDDLILVTTPGGQQLQAVRVNN